MKATYVQRHPLIAVILLGLLCTFMTALGSALPVIIGLPEDLQMIVTTVFLVISVVIGLIMMKKSGRTFADYGFRKEAEETLSGVWWYLPLLVIEIVPVVLAGFDDQVTVPQYIILLFFTIAVGFHEEIYFRGLAFQAMKKRGKKKAIVWTSVIFGALHLINVLNGKNAFYLILQMFFAFLVGFVLAEIISITKSLWILIIWHAAHDYIAGIGDGGMDITSLIILAIQVAILLVYAAYLWKRADNQDYDYGGSLEPSVH